MAQARLQKVLAHLGVASRRHCERLISLGQVRVNGQVAQLGDWADPDLDQITVDGRPVNQNPTHQNPASQQLDQRLTLLLHKPVGVVSTCQDPQGRPTVLDRVPEPWHRIRLYPVGRLDAQSSGALLLTNDGDLTLHLTHPRYHIPKTYWVEVAGSPSHSTLEQWRQGIELDGILTLPAEVERIPVPSAPIPSTWSKRGTSSTTRASSTWLEIVLHEGRNRQIRRVAQALCHPVLTLHRIAIGSLRLDDLKCGQARVLTPADLELLQRESHANPVS